VAERLDAVVVGAGVIGLAIARALARAGREVVVLERERSLGLHASSRNSEVLHAGLYYPPGSLKARLCRAGRHALESYCQDHGVEYRTPGKLIVATTEAERGSLARLLDNARACGVEDLRPIEHATLRGMEPELRATAALWSPSTGIIDSHGLMRSLALDAEDCGATIVLGTAFEHARPREKGLWVRAGDLSCSCALLVNAAGLGAVEVAKAIEGLRAESIPARYLLKGSYFSLGGEAPFTHLVYPVPNPTTLGIHVTLDLAGRIRLGPDQQWVDRVEYAVDPARAPAFAEAVARYYPALDPGALRPDYAGIRAKVQGPGQPAADFVIEGPQAHGIEGLCNLFGIESPGLTACLAIAEEVLLRLGV